MTNAQTAKTEACKCETCTCQPCTCAKPQERCAPSCGCQAQ